MVQLFELLFYLGVPIILFAFALFFSVLLHELGHAVPKLLMTTGRVGVYVGSFGDADRSLKCHIGRLDLFFKYNPLLWRKGLCKAHGIFSAKQRLLFSAAGPLTSLLLTLTCWRLLADFDFYGILKFSLGIMLYVSAVITLSSIIPLRNAVTLNDGRKIGNDAAQILYWLKYRKLPLAYWQATEHIRNQQYREAAILLDKLLADGHTDSLIYRNTVIAHLNLKDYTTAARVNDTIKSLYDFTADDYSNEGFIKSRREQHTEAMLIYQKALSLDPNHVYALNNLGYTLCVIKRDAEAISYFDKVLTLSPAFSHAYCNRGWAKINLGNLEDGLADVNHSLTLAPSDADAYRNLGLYYQKKKDFGKAIELFEKAKVMDAETPLVDQYLAEAYEGLRALSTPGTA
ncbi:MAG TPA: tetratricopeptide repeat protein [Chitinophagaceae bacterium]